MTAGNLSWNRTLRPGQSLTFGFIGDPGGQSSEPPVFFLNGEICATS